MNTFTETHFHTSEVSPCGYVPAAESIPAYKAAGYDLIVVTDHLREDITAPYPTWEEGVGHFLSGYEAARKAGEKCNLTVLLGAEITFTSYPSDFLLFGIDKEFLLSNPYPCRMEVGEFSRIFRSPERLMIQSHPFRYGQFFEENIQFVDGIEVCNANVRHEANNDTAAAFAAAHNLIGTAGQDYHQTVDLLGKGVLFKGRITTTPELIFALRNGEYELIT